jgi:hypothetical protein
MSVISFEKEGEVWESSSGFIYSMLLFFIEEAGNKDYLVRFKRFYDHGYNYIPLETLSTAELLEFRGLVTKFMSAAPYEKFEEAAGRRADMRRSLIRLLEMLDSSIMKRGKN